MIYLDNCATTRVFDQAAEQAARFMLKDYCNSSAPYAAALDNEKSFNAFRREIAGSIGAQADEIYFTSGGTESDNTVIFGAADRQRKKIIISATEHPAVYEAAMHAKEYGAEVAVLPVDPEGRVRLKDLDEQLSPDCALVSIMHVNNETGVINPIGELAELAHRKTPGCIFHSDGVQAHMRIECDVKKLGIDAYSVSGHKIHAPKGIGALYISRNCRIKQLFYGGGQQNGFRSGTVNLPAVAGYAAACKMFEQNDYVSNISRIKEVFRQNLKSCVINSSAAPTAPHILSVGFEGLQASTLQNALESMGVIVGKGSACSSRSSRLSRTLESMGLPRAIAEGTVRIGIGALNTVQEAEQACEIINQTTQRLMRFRRK